MTIFSRATYPNLITMFRFIITPLVILCLYFNAIEWALILFSLGCISDTLDGAVARSMGTTSRIGGILDHTADKLLIITTFLAFSLLGYIKTIDSIPVYFMIFRDISMSGVREIAAIHNMHLSADFLGKGKTVVQMLAIFIIFLDQLRLVQIYEFGSFLLWLGAFLSILSFFNYLRKMIHE